MRRMKNNESARNKEENEKGKKGMGEKGSREGRDYWVGGMEGNKEEIEERKK